MRLRRLLWSASALATVGSFAACGPAGDSADRQAAGPDVREPVTVTVLVPDGDERVMSPVSDTPHKFLMFQPLVARAADGTLEPRLARSWEPSADHASWTIHLDPSARWHDGVPVTSDDIKFTVELMSLPSVGYGQYHGVEIEVLDDSTFVWHSTKNTALDDYHSFFPRHVLSELDPEEFYEWEFWTHPVGNGPYRYVRHLEKTLTELEAVPDYFRGRPAIDRVILMFGSGAGALPELLAGNAHVIPLNPIDVPKVENDLRFQITYKSAFWSGWAGYGIMWNHRHPVFSDPSFRRAATLAIDRQALHSLLHLPDDLPVFDVVFTERQVSEVPEPLPYDPDAARRLLQEAGWVDTDGNGVRDRDGEELGFTAITDAGRGDRVAVIVQAHLRAVGVRMEIQTLPGPMVVWQTRVKPGDFEAAIFWWNPGVHGSFGPDSFLGYQNEDVHELLDVLQTTQNPAAVDSLYRELWPHFQTDIPVTFLVPRVTLFVSDRRLRGLSSPHRGDPVWYMEDLWWEEE
ncbi:MAG: ABC transporter substrate-binding protein [Gemmatimonadota bacterium]